MQYISDKRMLQDVLQTYFELGRKQNGFLNWDEFDELYEMLDK